MTNLSVINKATFLGGNRSLYLFALCQIFLRLSEDIIYKMFNKTFSRKPVFCSVCCFGGDMRVMLWTIRSKQVSQAFVTVCACQFIWLVLAKINL